MKFRRDPQYQSPLDSPLPVSIPVSAPIQPKMRLTTRELVNLDDLVPNRRGLLTLSMLIAVAVAANAGVLCLLAIRGVYFQPYIHGAVIINMVIILLTIISLFQRSLFYTPHFMSVATAVCIIVSIMSFYIFGSDLVFLIACINAVAMLGLWLAFATTVKSLPAIWLHPYMRPLPSETPDFHMNEVTKAV